MKTILIIGNITFLNDLTEGQRQAIVHSVGGIMHCESEKMANIIGDSIIGAEGLESYLIPSEYQGEILFEVAEGKAIPMKALVGSYKERMISELWNQKDESVNPIMMESLLMNFNNVWEFMGDGNQKYLIDLHSVEL